MTPYQAIQRMNKGYKYAFANVKTKKVISVHKDWHSAWKRVERTRNYKFLEAYEGADFDDKIIYDVISLFDIAFQTHYKL